MKKNWQIKKLGDVVSVLDNLRKPINSTERLQRINGKNQKDLFPYYGATGQVGWIDSYLTDGEFILVGEDGAPFLDNFKKKAYKISGKTWVNNHAHILKEKENITLNNFILYFLNSINYRQYVNGTTRLKLTKGSLIEIPFPIPNIKTQHDIVSKIEELFSELDKGIEDLKTAQLQLKTYRQSVLKWAFEGKLTNENVKDGKLPKGWEIKTLGELGKWKGGGTPSKQNKSFWENGTNLWVSSKDMKFKNINDSIDKITDDAITKSSAKMISKGAILFVMRSGILRHTFPVAIAGKNLTVNQDLQSIEPFEFIDTEFLYWFIIGQNQKIRQECSKDGTTVESIDTTSLKKYPIQIAPIKEQHRIIQEIESRLSVADKMEESIAQSLQQAEALRQSILKKAFSGELVTAVAEQPETKVIPLYKPKSDYFYQMQLLGIVAKASKQKQIEHGEMTLAKYAYLMDKVYDVPTYFNYNRWHLGPYPPTIKKVINNKQYFKKSGNHIEVLNEKTLFNSTNPYTEKMQSAVNDLTDIFSKYTVKERSHKTELLATICKVIEDIQSTDLKAVRQSMAAWKINLKGEKHKTKAEKFNEAETEKCLAFIKEKSWDKKLIK